MPPDAAFEDWLRPDGAGLCCVPGGFHVDPTRSVERAIVTHGHTDHARPGHRRVLATPGTLAIMQARLGETAPRLQALEYGERVRVGDVDGVAGARRPCARQRPGGDRTWRHARGGVRRLQAPVRSHRTPFEVVPCDVFVTEATFGLPVFRHQPDAEEIGKLLHSLAVFPERTHVVGVYALGKCQRVIALLRAAGYDRPIWLHGALQSHVRSL